MWYFAWILGVLLAVAFGVVNAMWLEHEGAMDGECKECEDGTKAC